MGGKGVNSYVARTEIRLSKCFFRRKIFSTLCQPYVYTSKYDTKKSQCSQYGHCMIGWSTSSDLYEFRVSVMVIIVKVCIKDPPPPPPLPLTKCSPDSFWWATGEVIPGLFSCPMIAVRPNWVARLPGSDEAFFLKGGGGGRRGRTTGG